MSVSRSSFASSSRLGIPAMAGMEYAIGIDLGTTYSCVAVWKNNKVEVIVNEQGSRITPSCVSFNNDERLIGEGAVNQALKNPTNTVFGAKRLIGRRYNEESVQSDKKMWPFRVVAGDNDRPNIIVQYEGKEKCFTPEEISSMVLSKMKEYAEKFLGSHIKKTVVTVPAYFNNAQREATKSACTIAGLDVIQVLNEPTAAALAYGLDNKDVCTSLGKRLVLIFDLGGGTFDVSLLELDEHGTLEVKATAGDTHLGGEDFDNRMVDDLVKVFERQHQNSNIRGNAKCMRRLKLACEKAKRLLSTTTFTEICIDSFYEGEDFSRIFSRVKFEELNRDLFGKCIECLKRCLEDAKVEKGRVDEVVLVGGSTRIPKVQAMLREFFNGKNFNCSINPDEAVAYGAAIQAASLNRSQGHEKGPDVVLLDVTPLSLGIKSKGDVMNVVVPRNTRIPCEIVQDTWRTADDNQTCADFCIYEGERPIASDNNLLGQFQLDGLRKARKGKIKFIVTFKIDMDGILNVTAINKDNKDKGEITITRDKLTLNKDEIASMISEAKRMECKDQERKKALQAKHELVEYLSRIRSKIDGSIWTAFMLSTGSRNKVESAMNDVSEWLEDHNDAPIHEYQLRKDALRGVIAGISGLSID